MSKRRIKNPIHAFVTAVVTVVTAGAFHASAIATTSDTALPSVTSKQAGDSPGTTVSAKEKRRLTITKDGTVVDGARVRGSISVKADDVTIKNSRVTFGGYHSIRIFPGAERTKILRTKITCTSPRTNGVVFGGYYARKVRVNGCRRDFASSKQNPAVVLKSWVDGKPFEIRPATPTPTPTPTPVVGDFPTPETTGPREPSTRTTGDLTSTAAGQVISRVTVNGQLTIQHDNVTVQDVLVNGDSTYMIQVVEKSDGTCPTNVRIEYTEIDGAAALENDIPLYSPDCGYVFDRGHIHNVGRTSRLVNNTTISNSYVISDRIGDSGAHRGAVGTNGGSNNQIINNVLMCEGVGCSAAIPMYGDFAPVDGLLVQHNLMATTGSYCAYGGSLDSKPYPDGSNIRFIDNHFSNRYFSTCGRYGPITSFANGVRGNEWTGNVWHESGRALHAPN